MADVANAVTMKGNPVTLLGGDVTVGQSAPDCTLHANDLSDFTLSSLKGKKVVLSVVPSLDTPICDLQTKRFNEEAQSIDDVAFVTISMDLPFAQSRWAESACGGNQKVTLLSDHRDGSFGQSYGVLIEGIRLLARAIFIVDAQGDLRYKQIVPEITNEPDYDEALSALKGL